VELRKMTDPLAGDRDVVAIEGDYLTVEQLAQLRQVTPAAIRAQLRAGNLAGEQVLRGQRTVWRIPVSTVRRDAETPGGSSPMAEQDPAVSPTGLPSRARSSAPVPSSDAQPVTGRGSSSTHDPLSSARVEALESEVRRLRRQLSALAEAHRRLLDAVTVDLAEDPLR
jgi:hypothetical protein